MKCRVIVLAIATVSLFFSQGAIHAEASVVPANSSMLPMQTEIHDTLLCAVFPPLCSK